MVLHTEEKKVVEKDRGKCLWKNGSKCWFMLKSVPSSWEGVSMYLTSFYHPDNTVKGVLLPLLYRGGN